MIEYVALSSPPLPSPPLPSPPPSPQVVLDPALTKGKSSQWKEMRREMERAGKLKQLEKKSALLPLFNKTGLMKIPAIRCCKYKYM